MDIDWTRTELFLRRTAVLHQQGRTGEFLALVELQQAKGIDKLRVAEYRERKGAYRKTYNQIMEGNEQVVEVLIGSYLTTESKEWRGEAARRLSCMLKILEGISDFLEAEIDIESHNLSENEVKIEKRSQEMRNFNDEYYNILVDASSWIMECRRYDMKRREQVEELTMMIRSAGI